MLMSLDSFGTCGTTILLLFVVRRLFSASDVREARRVGAEIPAEAVATEELQEPPEVVVLVLIRRLRWLVGLQQLRQTDSFYVFRFSTFLRLAGLSRFSSLVAAAASSDF